jgi:hypothetical protein
MPVQHLPRTLEMLRFHGTEAKERTPFSHYLCLREEGPGEGLPSSSSAKLERQCSLQPSSSIIAACGLQTAPLELMHSGSPNLFSSCSFHHGQEYSQQHCFEKVKPWKQSLCPQVREPNNRLDTCGQGLLNSNENVSMTAVVTTWLSLRNTTLPDGSTFSGGPMWSEQKQN